MKRLLYLSIGFTLLAPLAHADTSYTLDQINCESGSAATISAFDPALPTTGLKLQLDSKTLTVANQSYELVPIGLPDPGSKYIQTYRAFPKSENSSGQALFVEVSEGEQLVLIRRLDQDLSACGGGFINFEFSAR